MPLRTARGLGRLEVLERPFDTGFLLRDWLPDDRLEDPEAFAAGREPDFEVPLLRDAGGEDVRVAMVMTLSHRHTSLMRYTPDAVPRRSGRGRPPR